MQSIKNTINNALLTIVNSFFFLENLSMSGCKTYNKNKEPAPNLKLDFKAILF